VLCPTGWAQHYVARMTPEEERERFRKLPEPVRPEEMVETLDVAEHPVLTDGDDRDRLLREAGGV
jgi:hypothetical protein